MVRVLVVDDSAYMRKVVKEMLSRSPLIEVVATARDGSEALHLVAQLQPDVVTLDLMMPEMNGVAFLQAQMARRPVPVIVVSSAQDTSELVLQALDAGAIDFVQKPTALAIEKMFDIGNELVQKVQAAATVPMTRLPIAPVPPVLPVSTAHLPSRSTSRLIDIIVVGISTGGPQALKSVIPRLPADFPLPVAVVLHMPVGYTALYAQTLNAISPLEVVEAKEGDLVRAGVVIIARAGQHLTLRRKPDGQIVTHLTMHPSDTPHCPSVDVLFHSAAEVYQERLLGIVMTGMGTDGQQGAGWIKLQGGTVWTEAETTCVVYGMPRAIVEVGLSDKQIPLSAMAEAILGVI